MTTLGPPVTAADPALTSAVSQFLGHEAALLDAIDLEAWYELLADDFLYEVPIRVTQERASGAGGYDSTTTGFRQQDSKGAVLKRIERIRAGHAWAEEPPSRTTRVVGSIVVTGHGGDEVSVSSAVLLYRERALDLSPDLISYRREDVLRQRHGGFELVKRLAYLVSMTLPTSNLGIFL